MAEVSACPKCGKLLPVDALFGICSRCLNRAAIEHLQTESVNPGGASEPIPASFMSEGNRPYSEPENYTFAFFVFMPILCVLGTCFLYQGVDALRTGTWRMVWGSTQQGPQGGFVFSSGSNDDVTFQGADGYLVGVGLVALGTMIWDWCVLWFLARWAGAQSFRAFRERMGWLSLACLIIGFASFHPPWYLHNFSFWAVALVLCAVPPWLFKIRRDSQIPKLFFAIIFLTFGAAVLYGVKPAWVSVPLFRGMLVAMFASVMGHVHLLILAPAVVESMIPGESSLPAAKNR